MPWLVQVGNKVGGRAGSLVRGRQLGVFFEAFLNPCGCYPGLRRAPWPTPLSTLACTQPGVTSDPVAACTLAIAPPGSLEAVDSYLGRVQAGMSLQVPGTGAATPTWGALDSWPVARCRVPMLNSPCWVRSAWGRSSTTVDTFHPARARNIQGEMGELNPSPCGLTGPGWKKSPASPDISGHAR